MKVQARILCDTDDAAKAAGSPGAASATVRLWGIDGATRLERQLRAAGVSGIRRHGSDDGATGTVLLLRADRLYDGRVLKDLLARPGLLLCCGEGPAAVAVAAHVDASLAATARKVLRGEAPLDALPGVETATPASLSSAYAGNLLKADPTSVLPVRPDRATELERYLFDGAYKGVTDLVTKWVWPAPARIVTRICTQRDISPNMVTATSWLLAIAVTFLFAHGFFATGLLLGWAMTFLDTVDGKLARVTVTSTKAGHLFDHVLDLLHPPLWYIAWGWGTTLHGDAMSSLAPVYAAIVGGYVAGRLVEGAFDALLAGFPIFSWRPVDSYFRLILARRNPSLLLLTAFALAGNPRGGLTAVAAWTVLSSLVLGLRLLQAAWARSRGQALRSWLADLGNDLANAPDWARPFASDPARLARLAD